MSVRVGFFGSRDPWPPVNTVPVAQTVNEDTSLVFSATNGNQLSISDVDGTSHTVTLTAANGTLSLAALAGLTFTGGDGTADSSMTFSGTDAAIIQTGTGNSASGTVFTGGQGGTQKAAHDGGGGL